MTRATSSEHQVQNINFGVVREITPIELTLFLFYSCLFSIKQTLRHWIHYTETLMRVSIREVLKQALFWDGYSEAVEGLLSFPYS